MTANITIGDVARAAGVTKGTVSLVFSGKRKISEPTRARVIAAAERLDWTPSQTARTLATKRTNTIGLVLARDPRILATDAFFPQFLAGVEQTLSEHEMALTLQVVSSTVAENQAYKLMSRGRVDGALLLDLQVDDARLDLMPALRLPAVAIGDYFPGTDLVQVRADDEESMREVLDHLTGLGHTHIAHVSGPHQYVHSHVRQRAFQQYLSEAGLPGDAIVEADFTAQSGRTATQTLLAEHPEVTAITYANDTMAVAGMSYLQQQGIGVPDDISVTGFDDNELSAHLSPSLTSVRTGAFERGVVAAAALVDLINQRPTHSTTLSCNELIVRHSTGPVRSAP